LKETPITEINFKKSWRGIPLKLSVLQMAAATE